MSTEAYLYYVKSPDLNDVSVCASDNVIYPGTCVIYPTRYGLDLGLVIGNAHNNEVNEDSENRACKTCVKGACHYCPKSAMNKDECEKTLSKPCMGAVPSFEFVKNADIPSVDEQDFVLDDSECWDSITEKFVLTEVNEKVPVIKSIATPDEIKRFADNQKKAEDAVKICKEKIISNKLDMKLVAAHFVLYDSKLLFFFTATERVDFRALVKELVSVFKTRIELRQIGLRDEASMLGGLAPCGRDYCCHGNPDKVSHVTIKMAKDQNLSLNNVKISGVCGKLLCCVSYEFDFYNTEKQMYPSEGAYIKIGEEHFKVNEVNILSKKVTLIGPQGRSVTVMRKDLLFSDSSNSWELSNDFKTDFLN